MSPSTYAVIGDPIDHSLSPRLQTAALRVARLDADYVAVRVPPAELEDFVLTVRRGDYAGFNATIPHKEAVVPFLDRLFGDAARLHAANTVVRRLNALEGHNTDGIGFRRALAATTSPAPCNVLILGAGGSARAIAHALRRERVSVTVTSRNGARARQLATSLEGLGARDWSDRSQVAKACDLVVNTTPLGMGHLSELSPMPVWPEPPVAGAVAFDLVYGHDTRFVCDARKAGWTAVDGLEMLVQQGAESFRIWFDLEPDIEAMRKACYAREETGCSAS